MAQHRSEEIRAAASAVFGEMLDDLVLTCVMSAHREIKRSRVPCGVCGTMCRSHAPLASLSAPHASSSSSSSSSNLLAPPAGSSSRPPSRGPSPAPGAASQGSAKGSSISNGSNGAERIGGYTVGPEKATGGSTGIGSGSGRIDSNGNAFFDCLVCKRSVVSNRYAQHLSTCLGFTASRRGASRAAASKVRGLGSGFGSGNGTSDRGSPAPTLGDGGDSDGESVSGKKIAKKLQTTPSKRHLSPSKPQIKGTKKSKPSSSSSNGPNTTPSHNRTALPPSRLGQPPTVAGSARSSPSDGRGVSSSPERSIGSFPYAPSQASSAGKAGGGAGGGGGGGGMKGAKTLPSGTASNGDAMDVDPTPGAASQPIGVDDSGEEDADDY